jgi:nudix-type nucleoside diphosphatase (YffH/AdpP family)
VPIKILSTETLADDWATLKKYRFRRRHLDGSEHVHVHQAYDRGDGVTILPIDRTRGMVLLVRQFRLPVHLNPGPTTDKEGLLIETCAGRLDHEAPETGIRREAEEELGYRLRNVRRIFEAYMSPGSVTERIAFFVADYSPADRVAAGGGAAGEGEDIEVIEMPFAAAFAGIRKGQIVDGKTIMLLQYAKIEGLAEAAP